MNEPELNYRATIIWDNMTTVVENGVEVSRVYKDNSCLLYTSPSPRDRQKSRMPSSA